MNIRVLIFLFLSIPAFSQSKDVAFTVFLVGDAGKPLTEEAQRNFAVLKTQLENSDVNSAIIYLGDNIYPHGLPDPEHKEYFEAKKNLDGQLAPLKNFEGLSIFIPGNHDWQQGGEDGWNRVKNQGRYVESVLKSPLAFMPDGGCPGPVEIALNEDLILIVFDSQWLLHKKAKPGQKDGCVNETDDQFFEALENAVTRNKDKNILVASHHPVYTYGIHGGSTTLREHLFPLTEFKKGLYIPIPILGSIHPIYRKYFGNIQDTKNPRYTAVKNRLEAILNKHPNIVHAAGHEHSLQYSFKDNVHYVVSGSGSKATHVKKRGYAQYVKKSRGFVKAVYYTDGAVQLEYWIPEDGGKTDITIKIR